MAELDLAPEMSNDRPSSIDTTKLTSREKRESSPKIVFEGPEKSVRLRRSINMCSATALLTANTGGEGVFIATAAILHYAGSPGLFLVLWVVSGIVNFGLAWCFIEVGLILPKAGGVYFYVQELFGSLPGFVMLWGFTWMICAPAWALGSYTASLYVIKLAFPDCNPPEIALKLLAGILIGTGFCKRYVEYKEIEMET